MLARAVVSRFVRWRLAWPPWRAGNFRPLYDFPERYPHRVYLDLDAPKGPLMPRTHRNSPRLSQPLNADEPMSVSHPAHPHDNATVPSDREPDDFPFVLRRNDPTVQPIESGFRFPGMP